MAKGGGGRGGGGRSSSSSSSRSSAAVAKPSKPVAKKTETKADTDGGRGRKIKKSVVSSRKASKSPTHVNRHVYHRNMRYRTYGYSGGCSFFGYLFWWWYFRNYKPKVTTLPDGTTIVESSVGDIDSTNGVNPNGAARAA